MDLRKFCQTKHNIRDECNTLQLGTFSYYRNMDSEFSIADGDEGSVRYRSSLPEGTEISSAEWNVITGGAATIHDKISSNDMLQKPLGAVKFKAEGSEIIFGEDGVARIKPGLIETELSYPNCYIFCCSISDTVGDAPKPSDISPEYDSSYLIPSQNVNAFADSLANLLGPSINLEDLSLADGRIAGSHISTLGQPFKVRCLHGPVEYKEEKTVILKGASDFQENSWIQIFFQSMFWKDARYSSDREYRFVLFMEHPTHRFLPVKEAPKVLHLNYTRSLLK